MHRPEHWGFVYFSERSVGTSVRETAPIDPNEPVRMALRELYYRQAAYREATGRYATTLEPLDPESIRIEGLEFRPRLRATAAGYTMSAPGFGGATVFIRDDGRVWATQ